MIQSMTGYGVANLNYKDKTITVELKSLNSKLQDFKLRMPNHYRDKENDLRRLLLDKVERGKLEFTLDVRSEILDEGYSLNEALYKKYLLELTRIHSELGYHDTQLAQAIMRIPNVLSNDIGVVEDDEWEAVLQTVNRAIQGFIEFRKREGETIRLDLDQRCNQILALLQEVELYEKGRIDRIQNKLKSMLFAHIPEESIDRNRFEQEVLYYLEKMDISEEKLRLNEHLQYFKIHLNDPQIEAKGRKLSFISQEIGREINTIGSKANDADIQKLVVSMKDELEKIKEQLANIV